MDRKELIDLTVVLLEAGRIGPADLARYVQLFNTGHLTADMLPMSVMDMPGVVTTIEAAQAQAAVVARLTPTSASDYFKMAGSPVTTKTPPAVQKWLRVRTRDHFRGEFDRTVVRMGRQATQSGDVRAWQGNMQKELRAYYIRQHTAGVGRPPTKAEIDRLSILAVQQQAYLQRFAAEVSARQALGNPMSGDAIGSRSVLYGGPGWEEWHRGNESAEIKGDAVGMIVHYRAVDDGSTCSSCLEAANNGPYLVGKHPWPGSGTCEAFGRCRCRLEYEHNPEEWKRLSLADPSPPPATPPTEEKPAKPVVSDAVKAKRAATRKAKAAALKAAAAKETPAAPVGEGPPLLPGVEYSKKLQTALGNTEASIRALPTENIALFDKNGQVLYQGVGDATSVGIPSSVDQKFGIMTHNHPVTADFDETPSFSRSDIRTALNMELSELRAVGADYSHALRFKDNVLGDSDFANKFELAIARAERDIYDQLSDKGNLSRAQILTRIPHLSIERVAQQFPDDVVYARWPVEATAVATTPATRAAALDMQLAAAAEAARPVRVAGQELSLRRDLPDLIARTAKNEEFAFGSTAPDTDQFLDAIVKKQGYNGPAEVVTQARGDALLEEGDIRLYRGVRNQGGETATTNAFVTQYKDGDFFTGYGIYGNGAYASDVKRTAHDYANDRSRTSTRDIIQLNLRADARIISFDELKTRISAYKNELKGEYTEQLIDARNSNNPTANVARIEAEREASVELTNDPGRVAAYLGYDAIIEDFRAGDRKVESYYVILNRTATRYVEWD